MIRTRPRRLYRSLPASSLPLVEVTVGDVFTATDDEIVSIAITRGGSELTGVASSTIELQFAHAITDPALTGQTVRVQLANPAGLAALAPGEFEPSEIRDRFSGRSSIIRIADAGKASQRRTTLLGSSWINEENRSTHRADVPAGVPLDHALYLLLYRVDDFYAWDPVGVFDLLHEGWTDASYADHIATITEDYPIFTPVTRAGAVRPMTLPAMKARADARLTYTPHLTRSQAISPAQWEQPNEVNAARYALTFRYEDGSIGTQTRFIPDTLAGDAETVPIDWTHVRTRTDHFNLAHAAMVHRNNVRDFSIPSITVDLLALLASPNRYHHRQAIHLLTLDPGDSINFSADWPLIVRGVHIVTGMTEHISGSEWAIELQLVPYVWAFGEQTPHIPAQTWDAALHSWDSEPRTWIEA